MPSISIPARFNGPAGSANGGYTCGLLARTLPGPTLVRLHRRPPLDRPLRLEFGPERVELVDDEGRIAHAEPCAALQPPPAPPTLEQARAARERYEGVEHPDFAHCFVCSRSRPDGLHMFAGPLEERDLVACDWAPSAEFCRDDGTVRTEMLWAALDCPSFFGLRLPFDRYYLLGEMRGMFHEPVPGDRPLIVYAWPRGVQGRKLLAGAALVDADGRLYGHAEHIWIAAL